MAEEEKPKAKKEKWEPTTERFVAFFDIMGFKDRVDKNSHEKILDDFNKIKTVLNAIEKSNYLGVGTDTKKVKTSIFSDSIVLFSEDDSLMSFLAISSSSNALIGYSLIHGIPIKGAMSFGKVTADTDNFIFFGKPIINAFLLHEELCLYAVVLDENVEQKMFEYGGDKIEELFENALVEYNAPFKFGRAKHYILNYEPGLQDALHKRTVPEIVKKLSLTMSGRPRIYLDNTLEFFKQNVKIEEPKKE